MVSFEEIIAIISRSMSSLKNVITQAPDSQSVLISIGIVIVVAAIFALILKILKQEMIPAYIIAGIILGPLCFGIIRDVSLIRGLAEVGIAFLLFVAGLEMGIKKFKEILGTASITGIIQVVSVTAVSFLILIAFKFTLVEALILGVAISLSSTIVITKILADKNELNTLHAKLIIGVMFVQDIIAIVALALLSQAFSFPFLAIVILKLLLVGSVAVLMHFTILKPLMKHAASLPDLLIITSLAFLFMFVGLAYFLNLSIAIGAFIAGITLANSPYKIEISAKIKEIRNFFSVMFFVAIGMWLTAITSDMLFLLIPLLGILIIVEPAVTAICLRLRGYKTRTSLQVGFSFAQLSEFTLILTIAALSLGIVSQRVFDVTVLTAVISIAATPYTMRLSRPFSKLFTKIFNLIEISAHREEGIPIVGKKTILIFGSHRMGTIFLKQLEKIKRKILVIDFNPNIIKALTRRNIDCIYGDASNPELLSKLERLYLADIRVIISTIPKIEDNLLILKHFKKVKPRIFIALTAEKANDALYLYKQGADYVIVPMIISAEQSIDMIKKINKKQFAKLKRRHISYLQDIHKFLH